MFQDEEWNEPDFSGFKISHEKILIQELVEYATSMTNPKCLAITKEISEESLEEWMNTDNEEPVVINQLMKKSWRWFSKVRRNKIITLKVQRKTRKWEKECL